METGSIREVVLGFESMVGSIPSESNDFRDALGKLFDGFCSTMNELLPLKYFSLYKDNNGDKIAIFDTYRDCKEWIDRFANLRDVECSEITFSKFIELAGNDWSTSNYYSDEDGVLVFRLL